MQWRCSGVGALRNSATAQRVDRYKCSASTSATSVHYFALPCRSARNEVSNGICKQQMNLAEGWCSAECFKIAESCREEKKAVKKLASDSSVPSDAGLGAGKAVPKD